MISAAGFFICSAICCSLSRTLAGLATLLLLPLSGSSFMSAWKDMFPPSPSSAVFRSTE